MSSRLVVLAMIVAAAACAQAPRRARRPGQEYLAAIKFEGNAAIDTEALLRGLSLTRAQKGGRGLDEYQLTLDLSRIEGAYQRRGYLRVVVEPRVERKGDAATLVFKITEGPQAIATVEITGLPPEVPLDEARLLVPIDDGEPFSYGAYDAAKAPLLGLVEDAGYAHALLDASVLADRVNNKAILRYALDSGPRVRFGPIEVSGASGSLAEAVRERAAFVEGDVYSSKAVADTQLAIYGIGRFTTVRVDVDRAALADVVPVKISVAEATRNEVKLGGGAGLDSLSYQLRARASYSHKGWPSELTTLGAEFRPALVALRDNCTWYEVWNCETNLRARLIGTVNQQDLFVRGLNGDADGGYDYLALEAYTVQGLRARTGLELPLLLRKLRATLSWQISRYDFSDLSPAILNPAPGSVTATDLHIDETQLLGGFTQSVSIDYRDDPVSPRLGGYAEFKITEGTSLAGGAFEYIQLTPDIRGYVPIGRVVIAARARLGVIRGEVPATERYFAGGASSQRGFAERRLSPLARGFDAEGNPISVVVGGAASFETGIEMRTHFKPWGYKLGVIAFLDGADVTETPEQLVLGNLHWAVGVGIRPVYLPVGPLRFEVGYRLNRTGSSEPSPGQHWNYTISVGEAF